jgi:cytochrome c556
MNRRTLRHALLTLALAVGCADGDPAPDEHRAPAVAPAAGARDAHASDAGAGEPLLPIMQRLGTSMTALTHALMTEDHAAVQRSAAAIADHAPIATTDVARIQRVLGAEMAEFERLDAVVHDAAVRLHRAAEGNDPAGVVTVLAEVQRGCVECHAKFRERLRTNR